MEETLLSFPLVGVDFGPSLKVGRRDRRTRRPRAELRPQRRRHSSLLSLVELLVRIQGAHERRRMGQDFRRIDSWTGNEPRIGAGTH